MGLLSREQQTALIDLLLKLPSNESPSLRKNLLIDIPASISDNIDRNGASRTVFENIVYGVDDAHWVTPPSGGWPVVILIENAKNYVGTASPVGRTLGELLNEATARATAWSQVPVTTEPEAQQDLERQIQGIGGFLDSMALIRCEATVCRVEFANVSPQAQGTGFLLGLSVVMTNFHVMREIINSDISPTDVILRFDYTGPDDAPTRGQEYRLAADWHIDSSPMAALDYALVRVAGIPGQDPGPLGTPRQWLSPKMHTFQAGEPLIIIQHPNGRPRRFAVDRVKAVRSNGQRISYLTDTYYGSSGSPCFTTTFDLVALHQGFLSQQEDPDQPNKGIPFNAILQQEKVQKALGS